MNNENQPIQPENNTGDVTAASVKPEVNESEIQNANDSAIANEQKTAAEAMVSEVSAEAENLTETANPVAVPLTEEQFMESAPVAHTDEVHDTEEIDTAEVEDLSVYSIEELVGLLEKYVDEVEVPRFKSKIADIRDLLNQHFSQEKEALLAKFIEDGGLRDDFEPASNPVEERFHQALKKFNKKRIEYQVNLEKQKQTNLAAKREIIGLLKDLIQNEENMNTALNRYHDLQAKWRAIGPVPSGDVRDLQMTYHFFVKKFEEYREINKELRELDQRRNLEAKILLCEQAEELQMEPSINTAFKKLHQLQDRWRETGLVSREKKNEIWDRFKAACDRIFEKRGEFIKLAEEQRAKNLEAKTALCVDVEALKTDIDWKHKEWQDATAKITELQTAWRKIGAADKQNNDLIWARFKSACDLFYKTKNEFYHKKKQELNSNLQLKTELCIQAEALRENTDWRSTTAELKRLQDEWKKIGHVGDRNSEKIWKRFRTACDAFFAHKAEHFSSMDKEHDENLTKKNALIEEIEKFVPGEDANSNFEELKAFQRKWSELGMVPLKQKEEINSRYKTAIDAQFSKLKSSSADRPRNRYVQPADYAKSNEPRGKGDDERRVLMNKIAELKNDVQVWENNIGFFAKSKNADKLKGEFEDKINQAKAEIDKLKTRLETPKAE